MSSSACALLFVILLISLLLIIVLLVCVFVCSLSLAWAFGPLRPDAQQQLGLQSAGSHRHETQIWKHIVVVPSSYFIGCLYLSVLCDSWITYCYVLFKLWTVSTYPCMQCTVVHDSHVNDAQPSLIPCSNDLITSDTLCTICDLWIMALQRI